MKILSVVGARPQFVKLSPVAAAAAERAGLEHIIVHTGQHYDDLMSDVFFRDLGIPLPDVNLEVGSGSHGAQTGAMVARIEEVLVDERPDWVLVYGDTNSTLAAAIAAVKLHLPTAHLEAGLRSFNRRMPEEHNRVLADHAADLLLAPTDVAMSHLQTEGLEDRAVKVGDVMTDVCLRIRDMVRGHDVKLPAGVDPTEPFVVATIHRAENTDDPDRLLRIVDGLRRLSAPVLLLAHPRLRAKAAEAQLELAGGSLHPVDPYPYPQLVRAVMGAAGVVTDSGGLQKEAYLLQTPCTTLRTETEWTETLDDGWNVLDRNLDLHPDVVLRRLPTAAQGTPYGDGRAGRRAVKAIVDWPAPHA